MSVICIGGVCIPYTAVLPLIAYAIKYLYMRLTDFLLRRTSSDETVDKAAHSNLPVERFRRKKIDSEGGDVIFLESDDNFVAVMDGGWAVVKFTAEWCGPCKKIDPFFTELAEKWREARFFKVDIDLCEETSNTHKVSILPTFVLFKNGKEIKRMSGINEVKLETILRNSIKPC